MPCIIKLPDQNSCIVTRCNGCSNYVALVEMKSKCSEVTLTHDMEVVGEFGEYQEINIDDNPQLFKGSIPDASYRCQLLHGIASGSVNHAVYVVASLRKIICVVHDRVGLLIREQYLSAIANYGLATSALDYRGGCASKDNIQSRVQCS